MRTGTRCTTLIQLPVAFCAGSSAKAAPVPAPRPSTVPRYSTLLPYTSATSVTGWPIRMLRSCPSLKLASTQTLAQRDDRQQRRAGLHALAELDAAPGDVAVDRRDSSVRLQRQERLAHARRGAHDARVLLDRQPLGQRLVRGQLLARRVGGDCAAASRAARRGELGRDVVRTPRGPPHRSAPAAPAARRRPRRARTSLCARAASASRSGDLRLQGAVVDEQDAHLAHGLRQLRLGLLERDLRVGRSSVTSFWPALT